ncbi:transcription factor IIIB 90 kDa subunit-like [Lytechinus pictus]|uniref:transcription factor IIIB 90 kDa subunit-like n=1 Tax=Lytechinus pictus TaxID=7653 RepID=UPI0030BA1342
MKRDWIHMGRRPSGLCGAALLVAARMHNFHRTQRDVIKVVKVCDATLRKRLSEFEETPSGKLTIDEFHKIDLEEEQDPPSFKRGRRNAKLAQLEELSKKQVLELEGEITTIQNEIESALHKKPTDAASSLGSIPEDNQSNADDVEQAENVELLKRLEDDSVRPLVEEEVRSHKQSQVASEKTENGDCASTSKSDGNKGVDTGGGGEPGGGEGGGEAGGGDGGGEAPGGGGEGKVGDGESGAGAGAVGDSTLKEKSLPTDNVIDTLLGEPTVWSSGDKGLRPSALSLGLESIIKEAAIPEEKSPENDDGELDLTGINDREIDAFILSEKEVTIKTNLWMKENGEYMKQMEEKEKRLQKEREEQGLKPDQPKKKRKSTKRPPIQANTAGEAIEKLIVEKKISSKINYDVLRDLTQPSQANKPTPPSKPAETPPPVNLGTPFRAGGGTGQGGQLMRAGSLGGVKRLRPTVTPARPTVRDGPAQKAVKLETKEEKNPNPFTIAQPKAPDDIVVESGPVQYHAEEGIHHDDEGEDEYYDEEDDDHLQSAAQLMGHRGDDDYQDNYDMDDLE